MLRTSPSEANLSDPACRDGGLCGIDEAGRGPWAGPVVAAAVMLPPDFDASGIRDSKQLSRAQRSRLYDRIMEHAAVGIGQAPVAEIDRINILQAALLAMRRALFTLPGTPRLILVDGNRLPANLPCPAEAWVGGDRRSLSIAAASIVAKVTRDRLMADLHREHPVYGWARNAGYGTKDHRAALQVFGPCEHHRQSFAPVRACAERAV